VSNLCRGLTLGLCAWLLGPAGVAQDARGSLTGLLTDPAGAPIAGAQIQATNTATGVATTTTTNASGNYALLYLIPGKYSLSAEREGFERVVRKDIEMRVADELKLDLQLTLGSVKQTITVSESTPLLQAGNADVGQTIGNAQVSELPLADGNPFLLTRLVAGTVFTGNPQFTRPFDNGDTSSIRVNGAEGSNEFMLNGAPNVGRQIHVGNNVVAYVPPADAVQEFKMTTSSYSAQYGHTTGASVNVSTKSGTNQFHGTAYEFFRNEKLAANDFFLNAAGQPRATVRYNRFGGSLGGPVRIPKLYNGRNKTFFFFAYENLPDVFPEPNKNTTPTASERQGDLSALLPLNLVVYDPLTAVPTGSGTHVQRTPFPGNIIPTSRLSALSQNYLKFYPLPNATGNTDGANNFVTQRSRRDHYNNELGRIDHALSSRQRLSGTILANWRNEDRGDWVGLINGARVTGDDRYYINNGANLDDVITLSPTLILHTLGAFTRFHTYVNPPTVGKIDPLALGFSPAAVALMIGPHYLPTISIADFTGIGRTIDDNQFSNVYSFTPAFTKVTRGHTLNFGYDFRTYQENTTSYGNPAGTYAFNQNFTRVTDNGASQFGQGLAAFLLGQPTGGSIDRNGSRANQQRYHALFIQDDWKVTARLTLNLGLRYEYEGPQTERYNRNVRGFDLTTPNPVAAAAQAAFATDFPNGLHVDPNLPPVLTAANFKVVGGYRFPDPSHRSFWNANALVFLPRVGAAYMLDNHTVFRGGLGLSANAFSYYGLNQVGFSQTTSLVPSNDNGLTFQANFANPFPQGVTNPPGSSLGLATALGTSVTNNPVDVRTGKSLSWSAEIQRQIPGNWVITLRYNGIHGYDLSRSTNYLDAIPPQYLSTTPVRDNTVIGQLTANVPNPFIGLAPGASLNTNTTVQVQQLLRAFPQFTGIGTPLYNGSNHYESGTLVVEHRLSSRYTVLGSYHRSKLLERYGFLNDFETQPTHRMAGNSAPNAVAAIFIAQLPFGRRQPWGANWRGPLDTAFGGWQAQGIYQMQSGFPLIMGNLVYFGDPGRLRTNISSSTLNQVFDTSGFYFSDAAVQNSQGVVDPNLQRADKRIQLGNNIRTFPNILPNFRGQATDNIDLSLTKNFFIRERLKMELRGEALNAFNHPLFNGPGLDPTKTTFAQITSQRNLPREVQVAIKLVF
jgi:hypothetical protein